MKLDDCQILLLLAIAAGVYAGVYRRSRPAARIGGWACLLCIGFHLAHGRGLVPGWSGGGERAAAGAGTGEYRSLEIPEPPPPPPLSGYGTAAGKPAAGPPADPLWPLYLAVAGAVAYGWWDRRRQDGRTAPPAPNAGTPGRREPIATPRPEHRPLHSPIGGEDLIESLCRKNGGVLTARDAERYLIRLASPMPLEYITIQYREDFASVVFQAWFSVRFSLEREPQGLFARLAMRNLNLVWPAWAMSIGGSCEACLCLVARVPRVSLDGALFGAVCREMVEELHAFRQELSQKFRYEVGDVGTDPGIGTIGQPGRGGVPMRKPWDDDGALARPYR